MLDLDRPNDGDALPAAGHIAIPYAGCHSKRKRKAMDEIDLRVSLWVVLGTFTHTDFTEYIEATVLTHLTFMTCKQPDGYSSPLTNK